MLYYHEYVVRKHERGLLFKKGDFVRFLAPGTYRLFGTSKRYNVANFDLSEPSHSGIDVCAAFALRSLDRLVKNHTRFARQNGAHVTPTFMVDGLIDLSIGSGDTVEQWIEKLGPI